MGTPRSTHSKGCSLSQSVSTADCWLLNILPALSCLGISYLSHLRSTESHCYWPLGSSNSHGHPSHMTATLCLWLSGCNGKCVHCPGRVAPLGNTTLTCFLSPCCWETSTNPAWCVGHTAWHCHLPHPVETHPKTSLNPVGTTDSLPSSIQVALQENKSEATHRG